MNNLQKLISMSALFINVSAYSAIEEKYHCLSGQLYKNNILEGRLTLEKYKDSYLTTLEWSNKQVSHGRLHHSKKADLFIEQWSSSNLEQQLIGISSWKFEGRTINIKYNYLDEENGKFFQGELNCRN